jgi:hypothetical protein
MWLQKIARVASGAIANDLSVNAPPAPLRMLPFLQDQYTGAFTHYYAVSSLIERPARCFRRIIVLAQNAQLYVFHHTQRINAGIRAPGNHAIGIVAADNPVCFP